MIIHCLEHSDQFRWDAVLLKDFPERVSVDGVEGSFKINKNDAGMLLKFKTLAEKDVVKVLFL
jgi:hypothetical protein